MNPAETRQQSFLPDFCGAQVVFIVVLVAELLAIIISLAMPAETPNRLSTFALNSLFIQWIALSSAAALCIFRPYLNSLPDHWTALSSYLLLLMISLLVTEIAWWLLYEWSNLLNKSQTHGQFLLRCMGISAIVNALVLRYLYVQYQWRRHIESETEFRIQALQSRIRPHFLFNCMNTIASLTRTRPKFAEQAIEDLADLFRITLREAKQLVTLEEELSLCRRYLRIETHRLGDRLKIDWDVDQLPKNARLPVLTLQPLIENAIYHGIEPSQEGSTIHIRGQVQQDNIVIHIDNPLPPDENTSRHEGNRFAMDNIEQRLTACFGDRTRLSHRNENDRYHVEITIPHQDETSDR